MDVLRKKSGITLIVLIITIIVLLILAGVTIVALSGKNGILNNSKNAKEESELASAKEALTMELADILSQNLGQNGLDKLDGIQVDGYITDITSTSRVVALTKNGTTYYFLVDDNYNVESLNNIEGTTSGEGNNGNSVVGTSTLITKATLTIELIAATTVNLKIDIPENEKQNVAGYQVFVNNKMKNCTDQNEITTAGLTKNTTYSIYVLVYDVDGNFKQTNIENDVKTPDVTYLYNAGDYNEQLTGGWKYSGGVSSSSSHWTTYDNCMQLSCPYCTRTFITTNNAIDLTSYSKMVVKAEITGYNHYLAISTSSTMYSDPRGPGIVNGQNEYDISTYTGNQFIHFSASDGTVKIYQIYLTN